ncbi:MAG TPA: sigma 54-interacting transcriptional regulator [Gemmatimonadaceae bacterium]|nr:sigma 54-interacting transcriptional regulator [Gemmatimonadaceae bacterium]
MSDEKTISTVGAIPPDDERDAPDSPALVIAWCADEPLRVGEIALFRARGPVHTLGRGEGDGEARVRFFRQRPKRLEPTAPLAGLALSRRQLDVVATNRGLQITRVGRCPLTVNGVATDETTVVPGDTLHLRGQLLLYCIRRIASIPKTSYFEPSRFGAFGEPDAAGILGEAPATWELRERIAFAAQSGKHVLLHGESGTGKELAARRRDQSSVYRRGPRRRRDGRRPYLHRTGARRRPEPSRLAR